MQSPSQPDDDFYKTLLESTKAIPWKIDWKTFTFSYIGPQIEALLGWTQDSWVSAEDWAARMHPDDRAWVVDFCVSQSKNGVDHEADYRALTKDGRYVWIRDVVHVMRNASGEVEALVGFMFDISERKKTEDELLHLKKELEELSYKDALTGVSNRRMYNAVMDKEWGSAMRTQEPLSMLIIDIDFFKEYNDHYGHAQGDECLKRVSLLLEQVANRPRDFLARFGGEEFILVLPETDSDSAFAIAERCRCLILEAQLPHAKSAILPYLTVSVGVGSIVPAQGQTALSFFDLVDQRLYSAKQQGRNLTVGGLLL